MGIEILFFGSLIDATTDSRIDLELFSDTDELLLKLIQLYPALRAGKYFVAVNQKMIQENTKLNSGDTVALMPPFSGG